MTPKRYLEKNSQFVTGLTSDVEQCRKKLINLHRDAQTTDLGDAQELINQRLTDLISVIDDNHLGLLNKTQLRQFVEDIVDQMAIVYRVNDRPVFNTTDEIMHYIQRRG
ncbi:MAG: hypothetical protein PHR16_17535 [Methylovulum sp.]|nr:hypothetical protein [Methylovulum sp.]